MSILPSPEYLRSILAFDPVQGTLHWKVRVDVPNNWNTRYAGQPALASNKGGGYLTGTVNGKRVSAHRVMWALFYGEWPDGEIDHINGNPSDNRICNLRLATRSENCINIRGRRGTLHCYKGVYWRRCSRNYVAKIWFGGKSKHLGSFANEDSAARAYDRASIQHFGEYAKTNLSMGLFDDPDRLGVREAAQVRVFDDILN